MRDDADTAQVQAVRIPAGHHSHISHPHAKGVPLDGKFKQMKFFFRQMQNIPAARLS